MQKTRRYRIKTVSGLAFTAALFLLLSSSKAITFNEHTAASSGFKEIIEEFEKKLQKEVSKDSTGSFSAAIFKGDEIIWSKAFGKSDNQKGINADTSTLYRIGSISKSITAYLMMLLVQDGTIHLDDKVISYLPELKQLKLDGAADAGDITFRQLADHTSGLAREPELADAFSGLVEEWENKVLAAIPFTTLQSPGGKNFLYSNIGYGILGLSLSRAAHKPFIELVTERIFKPHGMQSSFYSVPAGWERRVAIGNHWDAPSSAYYTAGPVRELAGRGYKIPNGGVFASPNDMARFLIAQTATNDPLARNYRDTMETAQSYPGKNRAYGFGLNVWENGKGLKLVGHDGAVSGYNAYMVFNPESRIGVVIFRNCDNASSIIEPMANIVLNRLVKENGQEK